MAEGQMKRAVTILLLIIGAGGGAAYWYWEAQAGSRPILRYEEVTHGRLVATIGSTGTVQAQDVVDVGAQVAGRIMYIGKDPHTQSGIVDWGSEVEGPALDKDGKIIKPGTVLAQIDPAIYSAQVRATDAALKAARAD